MRNAHVHPIFRGILNAISPEVPEATPATCEECGEAPATVTINATGRICAGCDEQIDWATLRGDSSL